MHHADRPKDSLDVLTGVWKYWHGMTEVVNRKHPDPSASRKQAIHLIMNSSLTKLRTKISVALMKTTVVKLAPSNLKDLEMLFATSEECKECWCMNHRCAPTACPTGGEAKQQFSDQLNQNAITGLIAYIDNRPVGWCAIDKTSTQIGHDFVLENPAEFLRTPG